MLLSEPKNQSGGIFIPRCSTGYLSMHFLSHKNILWGWGMSLLLPTWLQCIPTPTFELKWCYRSGRSVQGSQIPQMPKTWQESQDLVSHQLYPFAPLNLSLKTNVWQFHRLKKLCFKLHSFDFLCEWEHHFIFYWPPVLPLWTACLYSLSFKTFNFLICRKLLFGGDGDSSLLFCNSPITH